ncbi:hypothetical protein [Alkalimonas mucilaginosa]|uniref:Phage abortive infection protein n=1 Tax=Alkalimonas mucilaginosa TaxID=3057676 RepID=A0ABU7JH68_9GAMM|nr:hypothetical protein [Alkalimonas sp. MEB004]MEE2025036.1 hypothetical protein [Alkalimonas sp. MEB004]
MERKKTNRNYVTLFFGPYTLLVWLAALSLIVHLVPKIFPSIPAENLLMAFLQAITTLAGVFLGWKLAIHSEQNKRKEDTEIRINAIMEEIHDLVGPMKEARDLYAKSARKVKNNKNSNHPISMTHSYPAYLEYFKYIIPCISSEKRKNIRNIYNMLESYNGLTEKIRLDAKRYFEYHDETDTGTNEKSDRMLEHYLCSVMAYDIHLSCRWMIEKDPNTLINRKSDFFSNAKSENEKLRKDLFGLS